MRLKFGALVLSAAISVASIAASQERLFLGSLGNTDPEIVEFIAGVCEVRGSNLLCQMKAVNLQQKLKPEEIPEKLAEVRANIEEHIAQFEEPHGCRDVPFDTIRSILAEGSPELEEARRGRTKQFAAVEEMIPLWTAACQDPNESTVMALMRHLAELESRTCRIQSQAFDVEFKRQAEGLWVSNEGPSGLCGRVTVTTLRQSLEGRGLFWEWEEKHINTNTTGPFCEGLTERTEAFSWRTLSKELDCEMFEYGF